VDQQIEILAVIGDVERYHVIGDGTADFWEMLSSFLRAPRQLRSCFRRLVQMRTGRVSAVLALP